MQLFPQPSSLFIKNIYIFSSQGVSVNNITSQTNRAAARPVTCGSRTHGDTEEPGDSRITTAVALCGRKPAGGAKKKKTAAHTLHVALKRRAHTPPPSTFETKAYASPQAHMHSQSHPHPPPHPHSPPFSLLFDQKHFLCICCPPSDDFQTSLVTRWRADESRNPVYLGKLNLAPAESEL